MNLDAKTVRRYLRAETPDELLTEAMPRERELDEHADYLAKRWEQGCTNAVTLAKELRERGYRGSARTRAPAAADLARRHRRSGRDNRRRPQGSRGDRLDHPARRGTHRP